MFALCISFRHVGDLLLRSVLFIGALEETCEGLIKKLPFFGISVHLSVKFWLRKLQMQKYRNSLGTWHATGANEAYASVFTPKNTTLAKDVLQSCQYSIRRINVLCWCTIQCIPLN